MLSLLLNVATTTITTLGTGGQIPIGGRPESESNEEISSEISDYLLTLAGIIGQLKF